jgi:uncharacterized protein (DUF885 family)
MLNRTMLLFATLSLAAPAAAQGWAVTPADTRLDAFFAKAEAEDLARDPEARTAHGTPGEATWTPRSDARKAQDVALARKRLAALKKFQRTKLSAEGQLNYDLYRFQLENAERRYAYERDSYAFTRSAFDPWAALPQFLVSTHRITSIADAEGYIGRIATLPDVLRDGEAAIEARAKRGIVLPAFNFADITRGARRIAAGAPCDASETRNSVWSDFTAKLDKLDAPAPEKARLTEAGRTAMVTHFCPGYRAFADRFEGWGKSVTRNDGIWAIPNGDALYPVAISLFMNGPTETPDAIHQRGVDEVASLEAELEAIKANYKFTGTTAQFFDYLSELPELKLPDGDEGKARWLAASNAVVAKIKARMPEFFAKVPTVALEVRAVEKEREPYQSGAYYSIPPADGSRPGIFYVNLANIRTRPLWEMETLTYHESIPGHYVQLSLGAEMADAPAFRRNFNNPAFGEGWAMYSEKLGGEMGGLTTDYARAGRIASQLMRAVRLVVETGIHAKHWSLEQSADYIAAHTLAPRASALYDAQRYMNWPGQGLSYRLGQVQFEELRAKATAELGDKFDLKAFHSLLLLEGTLTFPILRARVDAWIAERKKL